MSEPEETKSNDPKDVTGQFDLSQIPVLSLSTFVGQNEAMRAAEDTSWMGALTEDEARQLVTRSVTITGLTDMVLTYLAQDDRFGYHNSKADVMRHAIELLIGYYQENKMFLAEHQGFASDAIRRQQALRLDAYRAKIRKELRENISSFDDEMERAVEIADWPYIADRLEDYRSLLRDCKFETERRGIREVFAGSLATRSAVIAFWKWTHDPNRVPIQEWQDSWIELSEGWQEWYASHN